jgi:rhodanese-related sulfurtransferase
MSIDELLADARHRLCRLSPIQAQQAMSSGAALIDIRGDSQIARDGTIAGALVIARNVLEWRLDPSSGHSHPQAPGLTDHVILLCDEGYQSSLAAATLQQLGFARATDVDGGFQAWRQAGLPVSAPAVCSGPAPSSRSARPWSKWSSPPGPSPAISRTRSAPSDRLRGLRPVREG